MTTITAQASTVAEQIAANEAWLLGEQIDTTRTVQVLTEGGTVIAVAEDIVDVEGFSVCDACGVHAADDMTGRRNCRGFYCDDDFDANACHRECYA